MSTSSIQFLASLIGTTLISMVFAYCIGMFQERRKWHERWHKKETSVDPLKPRCTCGHWFNMHKDCGQCQQNVLTGYMEEVSARCPCTHYLGPDPELTGLWRKPITKE
jgi:hypothetical protein